MATAQRPTEAYFTRLFCDPWVCPRCGCRDWRVANTYHTKTDSAIHRRRVCRHCHHVRISVERFADAEGFE